MEQMEHTGFPSDETLAAFLDGNLDPDTRRRVIGHMTTCEECYSVVAAGGRAPLEQALPSTSPEHWARRFWWPSAAAAALVVLAVALGPLLHRKSSHDSDANIQSLVALVGSADRTSDARIAAFPYQARPRSFRGSADEAGNSHLDLAFASLKVRSEEAATPSNLHAYGVACLLRKQWDDAVKALSQASALDPRNDAILNDLSAAYLGRAANKKTATDPVAALNSAEAALVLAPGRPEALFNKALALEAMPRPAAAREAWNAYLRRDPNSAWADEARKRLADRTSSVDNRVDLFHCPVAPTGVVEKASTVSSHPFLVRQCVEFTLLPSWANLHLRKMDREAAAVLSSASGLASTLTTACGDHTVAQAIADIAEATKSANQTRLDALGKAYQSMRAGRTAQRASQSTEASAQFDRARQTFHNVSAIGEIWATLSMAASRYDMGNNSSALELLNGLSGNAEPLIAGERLWVHGMVLLTMGRPNESYRLYLESLRLFELIGDRDQSSAVQSLIAENLASLGDDQQAWQVREASLGGMEGGDARRALVVLDECAEAALTSGFPYAALLLQNEVVDLARREGDPLLATYAFMWRGLIRARLSTDAEAKSDFLIAEEHVRHIGDEAARARASADLDFAAGLGMSGGDDSESLRHYDRALRYFKAHDERFRTAQILLARGRAMQRSGRLSDALAEFLAGAAEIEQAGADVAEDRLRASFFGQGEELFRSAVDILVARGDAESSFVVAERGREQAFAGELPGPVHAPSAAQQSDLLSALRSRLPTGSLLIAYYIRPTETFAWSVSGSEVKLFRLPCGKARLNEMLEAFTSALTKGDPRHLAASLYDQLLRPVTNSSSAQTLVIVPDGALNELPFAALWDNVRAQFVVQAATTLKAPSAAVFLACERLADTRRIAPQPYCLSFGGGSFASQSLSDLRAVHSELTAVGLCHRRSTVVVDSDATAERFAQLAPLADIIHIAGHSQMDAASPALTSLVFGAAGTDGANRLYLHEVAAMRLHAMTVVLSACSTTVRSKYRTGGLSSVARAFVKAGVPSVVGTLWNVEDGTAQRLVETLHRELERGSNVSSALRSAQLAMISSPVIAERGPEIWSAYEAIGSR